MATELKLKDIDVVNGNVKGSWVRRVRKNCLINILVQKYKKDGFIVETELKNKGGFQYFEMRKYSKLNSSSQKILNKTLFFYSDGESFLSSYMELTHGLNHVNNNKN